MNIAEMHLNFREYAQQMGMQNVRAILPDQIDIYINQAINDEVNQLIRENIISTKDGKTDTSKLGQINALRTLYDVRTKRITFDNSIKEIIGYNKKGRPIKRTLPKLFDYDSANKNIGLIKHYGTQDSDKLFENYMYIVNMSINYISEDKVISNWCPIRIIDDTYLSNTLNDAILKNSFRSPIAVIYKNNSLELYIDKFNETKDAAPSFTVSNGKGLTFIPYNLRISVINKPAVVKFIEKKEFTEESIDCDLPEFMHGNIVKRAVDLYRVTINGSLNNTQQG